MTFRPMPEQEAIIAAVEARDGNIDVDALAGAGKSTTLKMAAAGMPGRNLALAFNYEIKESLKMALPDNFQVMTFNGLGMYAFGRFLGSKKLSVSKAKIYAIVRRQMESAGWTKGVEGYDDLNDLVLKVVGMARNHGLVPKGSPLSPKSFHHDTPEGWLALAVLAEVDLDANNFELVVPLARAVLLECIQSSLQGSIDFADQIYMACCFGGQFPNYDNVLVDEAQDLSPLNQYMVERCTRSARLLAVGDERQAIYAFRGADASSLPNLRAKFSTRTLALSTTFRCAQDVVSNLHWHAPSMQPAPWAPKGRVERKKDWSVFDIPAGAMVICRNNAPLVGLAFKLLRAGLPPKIMGGELDRNINSFILKVTGGNPNLDQTAVMDAVDKWLDDEVREALARDNPPRAERARDKAECVRMIPGATAGEMMKNIAKIFANEDGIITLCTGHKSKGLEAQHVYHLDAHLLPSRFAESERAKTQENNLKYVIDSRAKESLTYIESANVEAVG